MNEIAALFVIKQKYGEQIANNNLLFSYDSILHEDGFSHNILDMCEITLNMNFIEGSRDRYISEIYQIIVDHFEKKRNHLMILKSWVEIDKMLKEIQSCKQEQLIEIVASLLSEDDSDYETCSEVYQSILNLLHKAVQHKSYVMFYC